VADRSRSCALGTPLSGVPTAPARPSSAASACPETLKQGRRRAINMCAADSTPQTTMCRYTETQWL
jgi:hypothetical protein